MLLCSIYRESLVVMEYLYLRYKIIRYLFLQI
nr:MAG TPA: hypothetical protein [Bacteriophage sp.]